MSKETAWSILEARRTTEFCFYTVNHRKGTAEVYGPTLSKAIKCAEALGGTHICPLSSCSNTVVFNLPRKIDVAGTD